MKPTLMTVAISSLFFMHALAQTQRSPHYKVTDLGLVGGPPGQPFFVANNGLISGAAAVSDAVWHAMIWFHGVQFDLAKSGGLGGASSAALGVNEWAHAVGGADTADPDPNGEDFCGFRSQHVCKPFRWQPGGMTALPLLLDGANGEAEAINNKDQIVGTSEDGVPDTSCPPFDPNSLQYQRYEFKPVIWQNGAARELPTVGGDPDGVAFAINNRGQAVGTTGVCTAFLINGDLTYLHGLHAVLWDEDGTVHDLGNLGGVAGGGGNTAFSINDRGQVVGHMGTSYSAPHAYMWSEHTGMQDLGTLPGDFTSVALGINDSGDIVGISLDANFNARAYLRLHDGPMLDLNKLIPANSPLFLFDASSINSRGEIIGIAQDAAGHYHGFLATPREDGSDDDAPASADDATRFDSARQMLQPQISSGLGFSALARR